MSPSLIVTGRGKRMFGDEPEVLELGTDFCLGRMLLSAADEFEIHRRCQGLLFGSRGLKEVLRLSGTDTIGLDRRPDSPRRCRGSPGGR